MVFDMIATRGGLRRFVLTGLRRFVLTGTTLLAAVPAFAASPAAPTPNGVEEVVVTAVRRSTRLEKTPVTVSVVTGATIARRGIRELKQLSGSVPGLTMNESPGGLPGVSVRGVGTSAANQMFEQSIGLFVDGVYLPRARQYRDALFDVKQIEIVKGPQGVLFGKNTSVGAITIASADPGTKFSGDLAGDYEANFGSYTTQAAVDLPVSDRVNVRLAGLYGDEGGTVRNITMNRDEGGTRRWVLRGTVIAAISDEVTATFKMQAGHLQTTGNAMQWIHASRPDLLAVYGIPDASGANFTKYESSAPYGETYDRQNSYAPSLRLVWQLGNGATLSAVSGYSAYRFADGYDSDAGPGPAPMVFSQFHEGFSQASQEIRYASPIGDQFSYQAGVYALHHHDEFSYINLLQDFYLIPSIKALNVTGIGVQDFVQTDTAYSAFAQGDYRVSDTLKFSLGGRLGQENKDGRYTKAITSNLGNAGSAINLVVPLPPGPINGTLNDTSFDFSGVLSDQFTPTTLLYTAAGQGTKSGAFNNTAAFGAAGPDPFAVRPEITTSFEAGIKQGFWQGRGFATLAVYHMHIDGYQDSYYSTSALGFLVRSVNANATGIDAEGHVRLLPNLDIYGNAALEPQANITDGERLQRAPRFTAMMGARFSHRISDVWVGSADAQLQYSTSYLSESAIAPGINTSADYALADLRLALTDTRDRLEFSFRADNVLNRRYRAFSYGSLLATAYLPGAGGTPLGSVGAYNRPRTFTFGVRKSF